MKRRLAAVAARAVRAARGLVPDRNPLRRTTDRAGAAITIGLAAAFLAGAPLAASVAGQLTRRHELRAAEAQLATWHQMRAVLISAPVGVGYGSFAAVRWSGPGRTRHFGTAQVAPDATAGSTMTVWVDRAGSVSGPPLQRSQIGGQVVMAELLTWLAAGAVALTAGLLAQEVLDRRRLAAWEAEWAVTGPQWTKQR